CDAAIQSRGAPCVPLDRHALALRGLAMTALCFAQTARTSSSVANSLCAAAARDAAIAARSSAVKATGAPSPSAIFSTGRATSSCISGERPHAASMARSSRVIMVEEYAHRWRGESCSREQPAHLLALHHPLDPDRHRRGAIGDPVALGPRDDQPPGAVERTFEPVHHLVAGPEILLQVLHPLEVADDDPARVA